MAGSKKRAAPRETYVVKLDEATYEFVCGLVKKAHREAQTKGYDKWAVRSWETIDRAQRQVNQAFDDMVETNIDTPQPKKRVLKRK